MSQDAQKIVLAVQTLLRRSRSQIPVRWALPLAALLLIYLAVEPTLEQSLSLDLPGLSSPVSTDIAQVENQAPLRDLGGAIFESPAGLRYGPGSQQGHRLKHLKTHAHDRPDRPGQHGVFDEDSQESILAILDEAYRLAERGIRTKRRDEGGRTVYTADLERRIGFIGGESGNRRGRPAASHLRLVLQGRNVITAFPVIPQN